MCGIGGIVSLSGRPVPHLKESLALINQIQKHRGPDSHDIWLHESGCAGFAHRRLSIIDLATGDQPMEAANNWITYNGEIYNYVELRSEIGKERFRTASDTEVILQAYEQWGSESVKQLRGMFSFALWDDFNKTLFCGRDRFGIKPFYYTVHGDLFIFASEVKALLPFVGNIKTDLDSFKEYLTFQFCLGGKTLFADIHELPPGHTLQLKRGKIEIERYWDVFYALDFDHSGQYFEEQVRELLEESVDLHMRSDVPVGAYLSGGLDSSIVTTLATRKTRPWPFKAFTGKFAIGPDYDESAYARQLASWRGIENYEVDITARDFIENIRKVIYHLDYPVAGPGSFPQFMVSKLASEHLKVVLGGQGGDEIFGGYVRYLLAYFEQCIKGAIQGTLHNGNFIVTYESIIPNLKALKNYEPLLQEFWQNGLFEEMDRRYFRLVDRSNLMGDEINWEALGDHSPYQKFCEIFHGKNIHKESYFDKMTHFDFKTLLPALLQVEDRMSMAHGLESRVPFLDHPLVEFAATAPANVKFKDGEMKHLLRKAVEKILPPFILKRQDKMGFPVPLKEWMEGEAKDFIVDTFSTRAAKSRDLVNNQVVLKSLAEEKKFGRKIWGLLSLELWQQEFHDRADEFGKMAPQRALML